MRCSQCRLQPVSPVVIAGHSKPGFVLMSVESDEQLTQPSPDRRQIFTLDTIPDDLRDGLLALADSQEDASDLAG
jgi:hypothetical protein